MKIKNRKYRYKYSYSDAAGALSVLESRTEESVVDDLVRTKEFIEVIFKEYEDKKKLERVKFAFIIPTRASRFVDGYWEEVYDFLPALRYLDRKEAFYVLSCLPPFRIEMYGSPGESSTGVLIFAPIFTDMMKDFNSKLLLSRKVRKKVNEAVDFAYKRFDVAYVGLGATLPRVTNYGKSIKADVVTTTGHAGTTWLLVQTVLSVIEKKPQLQNTSKIGFIGGGAIGLAALQSVSMALPNAQFVIYDKRKEVNEINQKIMKHGGIDVDIADSNEALLEECQLIISAVTSSISVKGMDLVGKIIVDDSQPGSFYRKEVQEAGGELIWVVGEDTSKEKFVTRRLGYSYGQHGLHASSHLWGCEAEVAVIAHAGAPQLAVSAPVTESDVQEIGKLFGKFGVGIAPFQSHGELNS